MQISLKWVNELVNIETVNLEDLINKLTLGGFEVEEILEIEVNNEKVIALDISATANRSDSLSIQGISLEIGALLNEVPKISNYSKKNLIWSNEIRNLSKNFVPENDCLGFIAVTIENLNTLASPQWLQDKLICSGIIPQNNYQDFQSYILLETGYPFEFYDLEKIQSKFSNSKFNLNLVSGKTNTKFLAENDIEYNLDETILMLQANEFPISIAGIISNKDVKCENNSKSLLIEGSVFKAAKIRQQSRILGLRTDRSSRYEKALKNINLLESLNQLISLLRIANPNLILKFHTIAQPTVEKDQQIILTFNNIKKVLGPIKNSTTEEQKYISPETITDSLRRLKFGVNYNNINKSWEVRIPNLRSDDIVREIDLIEEIGRLYGFDNFLTRVPPINNVGKKDISYQTRKKLTNCLINLGLNELIQYSLVNGNEDTQNQIELINPLVKDYATLRISLLPNLIKAVQKNIQQGNTILEGFEYGHVFSKSDLTTIQEIEKIAGIFGGTYTKINWSENSKLLNWFEAKGRIEQLFKKLNLEIYWKSYQPIKEKNILHPYCSATIYFRTGEKLGIFGQINPITAKKLNISPHLYLFEFNFELLQNQIERNKLSIYSEYSLYPKIIKDLSFIIHKTNSFSEIKKILYLNGSQFLININLLDEYKGKNIPKDSTSLCLQFIFQSDKTTLENKKIENIMDHLKTVLITKFNATIRT